MTLIAVDSATLINRHPTSRAIRGLLPGMPKYVDETCAVQLSYAMNRAGSPIESYAYADPGVYTGKVRGFEGSDGMNYLFAVPDMKVYLNNRYGAADNYKGSRAAITERITGRTGIMAFGHRHIDIWVKDRINHPEAYDVHYLWTNASIKLRGLFFWEVPDPVSGI